MTHPLGTNADNLARMNRKRRRWPSLHDAALIAVMAIIAGGIGHAVWVSLTAEDKSNDW